MKVPISLALAGLTIVACSTSGAMAKRVSEEERPNYHQANDMAFDEEHFDAGFYDRKAPNERSDEYRKEQIRNGLRSETETALIHGTREEKILILQDDLRRLRQSELAMALQRSVNAEASANIARKSMGWFPSKDEKERLVLLEGIAKKHADSLAVVQAEERALEARLKPLYGIVSREFWVEQRRAISNSIETVHKMAADNAWYSALFSLGNVESLQELVMQIIGQYVIATVVLYFFGVVFYALWTAPWTVYAYSSSVFDIIPGIVSYILAVGLMLLPLLVCGGALVGLLYYTAKNRAGPNPPPVGGQEPRPPQAAPNPRAQGVQQERARQEHQNRQQERYAPQMPRNEGGGFGGPVHDVD